MAWSLVITEAKVLGVPVIATKTAGALEQLEHNVTGILCDFDAEDIAMKMESLMQDNKLGIKLGITLLDIVQRLKP